MGCDGILWDMIHIFGCDEILWVLIDIMGCDGYYGIGNVAEGLPEASSIRVVALW